MDNPQEWAEREFGGEPPYELLDLCHQVACWIHIYMIESDDFFAPPPGCHGIDIIRLKLQSKLFALVTEAIRLDRQAEGPEFYATVPQTFKPWVTRPKPPLRDWIRRKKCVSAR